MWGMTLQQYAWVLFATLFVITEVARFQDYLSEGVRGGERKA